MASTHELYPSASPCNNNATLLKIMLRTRETNTALTVELIKNKASKQNKNSYTSKYKLLWSQASKMNHVKEGSSHFYNCDSKWTYDFNKRSILNKQGFAVSLFPLVFPPSSTLPLLDPFVVIMISKFCCISNSEMKTLPSVI